MDFVFHTQKKNEDKFTFKKLNLCALSSQQNPGTRGVYPSRSSWLCPHIPPPELMSLHPQSAKSLINPKHQHLSLRSSLLAQSTDGSPLVSLHAGQSVNPCSVTEMMERLHAVTEADPAVGGW